MLKAVDGLDVIEESRAVDGVSGSIGHSIREQHDGAYSLDLESRLERPVCGSETPRIKTVNKFERTRFFLFLTMSHSLSRYSICGFSEHTIGVKRIGSLKLMNVLYSLH